MTVPHPSGRRPAVSHGGDLPDDPEHPRTLGEALARAAQRFPDAGLHLVAADGGTDFLAHPDLLDRARAVRDAAGPGRAARRVRDPARRRGRRVLAGVLRLRAGRGGAADHRRPARGHRALLPGARRAPARVADAR
ncbi:hypothetical protein [Micromonospora inyonensis]|uniref:hypothetical protein n=1 Tax=Micromonospora inyonensis TaxID=47866 RepID=UPI000B86B9CE|nr:hypothetical protein [Micromonospora inyonensis]